MSSGESGDNSGGRVVWITGLSGSGKSTLAAALVQALQQRLPSRPVLLDGDALREVLGSAHGAFDLEGRLKLAYTYGRLCRLLALQGQWVVIATVSLFHEVQEWNRLKLPGYFEVFLDIPAAECARRNPKGLHHAAGSMVGFEVRAEYPRTPELVLSQGLSVEEEVAAVMRGLFDRQP